MYQSMQRDQGKSYVFPYRVHFLTSTDPRSLRSFPDGTLVSCSSDLTVRFWDLEAATARRHALAKLRHKTRRNIFSRELLLALTIGGFAKGCTARNKPRALALRHGGFEVAVGDESGKIVRNLRVLKSLLGSPVDDIFT